MLCLQAGAVDNRTPGAPRAHKGATIRSSFKAQALIVANIAVGLLDSNAGVYVVTGSELPEGG
jgi:hypothetical protein